MLGLSWPDLDPASIVNTAPDRYFDHGREGFRLSMHELPAWLDTPTRRAMRAWQPWLSAVTGHHGEIPDFDPPLSGYAEHAIKEQDQAARHDWVQDIAALFLGDAGLGLADTPPPCNDAARALLAGFCSLCDWIGSNVEVSPYTQPGVALGDYFQWQYDHIRDTEILRRFGLTATPRAYQGVPALLRPREQPRGIQTLVDTLPTSPGLTIVEAPTGSGKTEAALAYAWRLLDAGLAESIVFALPTQATANAMLARCRSFAERAFGRANLVLAHGHSLLNHDYQHLIETGLDATAQGHEEATAQCSAWLASSRKRVFLGQIGVCTIDQVLLSVLPVRHNFVRAFGLHRSVLIVDEVHAYDAYMHGLLGEVLKRQKAVGGSCLLLSATLPSGIRRDLLKAWDTEIAGADTPYPAVWSASQSTAACAPLSLPDAQQPLERIVQVTLSKLPDALPDARLLEEIIAAAKSGALVGIVMNTVDNAQWLSRRLRRMTELPVDLFHARFRLADRQRIERHVIESYGRHAKRSQGRILVATQVIEQSLDLDFDWLISQLCPVDLLFQRLGRLHRHSRDRPSGYAQPSCTVLSVTGDDYDLHELIYGDARLLWRTEQLLAKHREILFPEAYRDWIERVYEPEVWDDEPGEIYGKHMAWKDDQESARLNASRLTTMTLTEFRDDDERATSLTRDGEMSLSVLLLQEDGRLLDGEPLDAMDEKTKPEAAMLSTAPAPHSWNDRLASHDRDDDGRIRLRMVKDAKHRWLALDGSLVYSDTLGLAKSETADSDDPPSRKPR